MLCPLCLSNKSFFSIRALAWSLCSFIHESKTTIHVSSGVLVLSNDVTVKLVPRTSCFFMLDVHKNHCQHQEYQRTMSFCNKKNFIAKIQIISSHIVFLITLIA